MRKFTLFNPRTFESKLFNEVGFYPAFIADLKQATSTIILASPFVSYRRSAALIPELVRAIDRGVSITINTRRPDEHDDSMHKQAQAIVNSFKNIGIKVQFVHRLHRKLAVVDKSILWEGSLNILSQSYSCEVMRRTMSNKHCRKMLRFIAKNRVR